MGRIGASRRQSVSFCPLGRGARSVSSVAAQLGSLAARRSSDGNRHTGLPISSAVSCKRICAEQFEGA